MHTMSELTDQLLREDQSATPNKGYGTTLGYQFKGKMHAHSPGHTHLFVRLRPTPTLEHYDPQTVNLRICSSVGEITKSRFAFSSGCCKKKIPAGVITIEDRIHKKVKAFTFGGSLNIENNHDSMLCTIASTAPIIGMDNAGSNRMLLVEQAQILLAERRATWGYNHIGFEERLCHVEPMVLYATVLNFSLDKYKQFPYDASLNTYSFINFLRSEIQALQRDKLWPGTVPGIDDIL